MKAQSGEYLDLLVLRLRVASMVVAALFAAVAAGYWYVQIVQATYYRALAENNRLREVKIQAPRGLVLDRHGRRLVENIPSYNLLLDRSRSEDVAGSLDFASEVLNRDKTMLQAVLERYRATPEFVPGLLAEDLSLSQVARFEVSGLEHPEFQIEVLQRRLYRHGEQTAHVLGYLGEASREDLERAQGELEAGDLIGKEGIEEAYDGRLRGREGEQVQVVDSRGKLIEQFRRQPAQPGEPLVLTLDLELQQEAEHLLSGLVGAVVALDPRNGELRVMVSSPSYDPNLFARRLERREWYELLASPHQPLQHRAIHNAYAPGSLFKIIVATAGLSEGVVTPQDTVWCGGQVRIYNRRWRCWFRGGHGKVDLHDAIKYSCDIYFYMLGQELGVERIAQYARRFGLGQPTGVDIGGERRGLVPDEAWSLSARNAKWYPGETISVAIGQGPLLVTPLQVASMMAVVANGGDLVTPHLVRDSAVERQPTDLDPEAISLVRQALWAVVNDGGSGARARLATVEIAGKTGTAQVIQQKTWTSSESIAYEHRDHAWFAAFGPFEDPELVIVVFIEHGGVGSRGAAPIAKKIYEKYFSAERITDST